MKRFPSYFLILMGLCSVSFAKDDVVVNLSGKVASFDKAHKSFRTSCMPCHSAQLPLAWYGRMPLIKQKMKKDYLKAIEGFNLDSQVYVVGESPSAEALNKIEEVLQKGTMPPRLYVMKHLSARLSKQEEWAILNWIRDERAKAQSSVPIQVPQPLVLQNAVAVAAFVPQSASPEEEISTSMPAKKSNPFKPFDS